MGHEEAAAEEQIAFLSSADTCLWQELALQKYHRRIL